MGAWTDIAGKRFDRLVATTYGADGKWDFLCDCGKSKRRSSSAVRYDLKKYGVASCGCRRRSEFIGKRFGALTVVAVHKSTLSGLVWECRCDCGGSVLEQTSGLTRKKRPGCLMCESARRAAPHITHGATVAGADQRLYKIWGGMLKRCRNVNDKHYGAKGITVCEAWQQFAPFREWALAHGYENPLTIERIDPMLGYSPQNCEWITFPENRRRMLVYHQNFPWGKKDRFGLHSYLPIEALFGAV